MLALRGQLECFRGEPQGHGEGNIAVMGRPEVAEDAARHCRNNSKCRCYQSERVNFWDGGGSHQNDYDQLSRDGSSVSGVRLQRLRIWT